MILHHIVTLIAIISSDLLGYRDVGLHVLLLHDASDIFIMGLKLLVKILSLKNVKRSQDYIIVMYLVTLSIWIYLRLYKFVYKLCLELILPPFVTEPFWDWRRIPSIMLFILGGCNLFWTKLMIQLMFQKSLTSYEA